MVTCRYDPSHNDQTDAGQLQTKVFIAGQSGHICGQNGRSSETDDIHESGVVLERLYTMWFRFGAFRRHVCLAAFRKK